jgi:hypothetical protein
MFLDHLGSMNPDSQTSSELSFSYEFLGRIFFPFHEVLRFKYSNYLYVLLGWVLEACVLYPYTEDIYFLVRVLVCAFGILYKGKSFLLPLDAPNFASCYFCILWN